MQALSARSNAPECHIGHADRFKQSRSADFGTGMFMHQGSLGPQGVSTKPSLPSYSLGASTRDQMYKVQPCWYQSPLEVGRLKFGVLVCLFLSVAATDLSRTSTLQDLLVKYCPSNAMNELSQIIWVPLTC